MEGLNYGKNVKIEGKSSYQDYKVNEQETVEWEGNTLYLTQEPYLELYRSYIDAPDMDAYRAHAIDKDGNEYNVFWEILNDSEDESDRCDWDTPMEVKSL